MLKHDDQNRILISKDFVRTLEWHAKSKVYFFITPDLNLELRSSLVIEYGDMYVGTGTIDDKYRITIPKNIRKMLKYTEDTELYVYVTRTELGTLTLVLKKL